MDNLMDYKIAFVVLLSLLLIIVLLPFGCFCILTKMRHSNFCYRNRIVSMPENNLPV